MKFTMQAMNKGQRRDCGWGLRIRNGVATRVSVKLMLACGLAVISGCASNSLHKATPTSMDAASVAVDVADDSHVADFAPDAMRAAHQKLLAARQAMGRNELVQAQWYADEAVVNANIALARANKAKAQAALIAAGVMAAAPTGLHAVAPSSDASPAAGTR